MQPLHTDEYLPAPLTPENLRSIKRAKALAEPAMARGDSRFWSGRQGTAAGLLALNAEFGAEYFAVPKTAVDDPAAADDALGGSQVLIDAQTHYIADRPRPERHGMTRDLLAAYRASSPEWWRGLDGITGYNFAEFLRCVFLETETAVAVLTSGPGRGPERFLFNDEMAGTRRLLDELAPRKRLLQHAVVHPNIPGELELMEKWRDELNPAGWKVYTLGLQEDAKFGVYEEGTGWMLDDPDTGMEFLDRVRELGGSLVCAHKGLSGLVDTGSPRDVGPAARSYPDLDFLIYHSGYEWPTSPIEEGPYTEESAHVGSNRLIKSLLDAGIKSRQNVYAELGTTWFLMLKRPREAAHVLGKLLRYIGDDNVIWGTDSIWYGPTQPLVDAFRAFQIPVDMQEQYGYPPLTELAKEKILSLNAARLYGINLDEARENVANDDLAWIRDAVEYYKDRGAAWL
jgi:predicted TIM-barrel fold metal-dependent hydrolase